VGTFILRRLIQAIFILFGLSIVFFIILRLTPGGPCAAVEGGGVQDEARMQACIQRLGLNQSPVVQYENQMSHYLHGDFGTTNFGNSVSGQIASLLPATLLLMGVSYLLQQLIALPLGIFAAIKQYSFFDGIFTVTSYVGISVPAFWLGLILIYVFANHWNLLPPGHIEDISLPVFWSDAWKQALIHNPALVLGDLLKHLILPAFVLMVTGVASDSRYMRASMLEVINQDYIRTAKAKGVKRRTIIFKHAFRNAVLPIITNVALYLPSLVGGAIIVESIFTWNGLGLYYYTELTNKDFPSVQALLMVGALATLLSNLLADVTYAFVDPRIRYD
jgi:peptide/nickel transport system permease protein